MPQPIFEKHCLIWCGERCDCARDDGGFGRLWSDTPQVSSMASADLKTVLGDALARLTPHPTKDKSNG